MFKTHVSSSHGGEMHSRTDDPRLHDQAVDLILVHQASDLGPTLQEREVFEMCCVSQNFCRAE